MVLLYLQSDHLRVVLAYSQLLQLQAMKYRDRPRFANRNRNQVYRFRFRVTEIDQTEPITVGGGSWYNKLYLSWSI